MTTKVQAQCISKKESQSWNAEKPINTAIELQIPYDPTSIYYQMSNGTSIVLNTINQEAANMFEIGKNYEVLISPVEAE